MERSAVMDWRDSVSVGSLGIDPMWILRHYLHKAKLIKKTFLCIFNKQTQRQIQL